jgi:protein SCO1
MFYCVMRFRLLLGFLLAALAFQACSRSPSAATRSYQVRGFVRGIAPDRSTLEVQHEDIPNLMPAMTMPFVVRDKKQIARLNIGDAISFRLDISGNEWSIRQLRRIDARDVHVAVSATPATSVAASRLREGDAMPDFHLTNQNGGPTSLQSFRGHPFIVTFIFTRCPMPKFCPFISGRFADLQRAIKSTEETLASTRLLSITLDPEYDRPAVLKQYGDQLGADFAIWMFATGERREVEKLTRSFSVYVQPEGGTISHGLATALINGQGKIVKIWRGNGWTPEEIVREISEK